MSKAKPIAAGGALAVVVAVLAVLGPFEGDKLTAYKDIVGVWTACRGVTDGVVPGKTYTPAECDAMNRNAVTQHLIGVSKCIKRPLAEHEWVAVGSWVYNTGVGAACRSRLVRLINEGYPGYVWCQELDRWVYAGGKRVRGLERRRAAEKKVCLGQE